MASFRLLSILLSVLFTSVAIADARSSNLSLLEGHRSRLTAELQSIEARLSANRYAKPWLRTADEHRRDMKREMLAVVTAQAARINASTAEERVQWSSLVDIVQTETVRNPRAGRLQLFESQRKDLFGGRGYGLYRMGGYDAPDVREMLAELLRERGEAERRREPNPELVRAFFARVGARVPATLPAAVDQSARFHAPRFQGQRGRRYAPTCVAFAMTSDLETFTDVPPLSVGLAHSFFSGDIAARPFDRLADVLMDFHRVTTPLALTAQLFSDGVHVDEAARILRQHPLAPESDFPYSLEAVVPTSVNAIGNRHYAIDGFAKVNGPLTATELRQLLASGVSPMLGIDSDARLTMEDWFQPEKGGDIRHIFVLVGYGTGVSPFDLRQKPYFLVRDSMGRRPLHYKIAADELEARIDGAYKITGLRYVRNPPAYRPWMPPARD